VPEPGNDENTAASACLIVEMGDGVGRGAEDNTEVG
jgi:hypothetical protein